MRLTKEKIKSLSSKDYIKYRKQIRKFYEKDRILYQTFKNSSVQNIVIDSKYYMSAPDIENEFLKKINIIYWSGRKYGDSQLRYLDNPWLRYKSNVKHRCENSKDKKYKYYGEKGIQYLLDDRDLLMLWIRDKAYLMKQPSINRKDSKGNYTLKNCQFIELG